MKSIANKFAEACEALRKANKFDKFREVCPIGSNMEAQLNCAEAVLSGKVEEAEAARRTVRKHNGAADNGHTTLIRESNSWYHTVDGVVKDRGREIRECDATTINVLFEAGQITAEQKRVLLKEEHPDVAALSDKQRKEFRFARAIGISEADSLKIAHMVKG